jgi:glycosyltransferase involved in cell wall biosynthesis
MNTKYRVWVNMMVKNEERWIWYALMAVLPLIDKALVWDTGSTDKTVEIIKTIKDKKIDFYQAGSVNKKTFSQLRQKMLQQTKSDWVLNVAGDEIWPNKPLKKLIKEINKAPESIQTFCVRPINFVGDIRFVHPETFIGQTPLAPKGITGFFSSRVFRRNISGLHISGQYGQEGFYDGQGITIRERQKHVKYLEDIYYWHMTYLPRSSSRNKDKQVMMRGKKRKFEIGLKRPDWIKVPEVFYKTRPDFVPDPFYKMNSWEYTKALIQTPLKRVRRWMVARK